MEIGCQWVIKREKIRNHCIKLLPLFPIPTIKPVMINLSDDLPGSKA